MAKIVYRQIPTLRELPQQISAPGQKLGCKRPRMGSNFWCKSPGLRGGMVVDEIDTCIMSARRTNRKGQTQQFQAQFINYWPDLNSVKNPKFAYLRHFRVVRIPDNIFFLYLIIMKLCTLKQLENIH